MSINHITKRLCGVEQCGRPHMARGWCNLHLLRWYCGVSFEKPVQHHRRHTGVPERFWSKVNKDGPLWNDSNCWLWTGTHKDGYGRFLLYGRLVYAHRWAYEETHEVIPEGLEPDHLCRRHACVNPQHLDLVTKRINILRGISIVAKQARQTHCKRGHPFDLFNTYYIPSTGSRACRACKRARKH